MSDTHETEHEGPFRPGESAAGAAELEAIVSQTAEYKRLKSLLTTEGKNELASRVDAELGNPSMKEIAGLYEQKARVDEQYAAGAIDSDSFTHQSDEIRTKLRGDYDPALIRKFEELKWQQTELQRDRVVLLGDEAARTADAIVGNAKNADVSNRAHVFVDPDELRPYASSAFDSGDTLLLSTPEQVKIPLGMFVSAASFESWYGRPEGIQKDRKPSSEVIEDYAGRETKPPPVEQATGYLLPDGRVYFKSENAHRAAAAIRRGDDYVEFKGQIRMYLLAEIPQGLQQ
jgi:hypothetical protein